MNHQLKDNIHHGITDRALRPFGSLGPGGNLGPGGYRHSNGIMLEEELTVSDTQSEYQFETQQAIDLPAELSPRESNSMSP